MGARSLALVAAASLACAASARAASQDHGAELFDMNCSACHSVAPTLKNKMGPSLFGVVGRKAGTVAGYVYSAPLAASGIDWTPQTLDGYLTDSKAVVPDNKMKFDAASLRPEDRADIISFLEAQK